MRWLDRIDRAAMVARLVSMGVGEPEANLAIDRLLAARVAERAAQIAALVADLNAQIDALTVRRDRAQVGRQFIVDNAPASTPDQVVAKDATLATIDDGLASVQRDIDGLVAQRDALA